MTGDFAQDTSTLNMSAATQPPASSRPLSTATGSPSNGSSVKLTSSIPTALTVPVAVEASDLRSHAPPTIAEIPSFPFLPPRNHGATS